MENMRYDHNNNVDNIDPDHMMRFPLGWVKDSKKDSKQFISKAIYFFIFCEFPNFLFWVNSTKQFDNVQNSFYKRIWQIYV
jgi:hypothetical protein